MTELSIGETAAQTGLTQDTLRYYERIGLLSDVARDAGGRRRYSRRNLSTLGFIKRAQAMNFSLREIAQLLSLRESPTEARDEVRALTHAKLAATRQRIEELERLRNELQLLVNLCRGSADGCPIIDDLEAGQQAVDYPGDDA